MASDSRTRLAPEARRAQLVDLGLEMLSTRPLDRVAIDEIAERAGISRGLLFHYFPTKHDFHVAVVQAAADELYARSEPDPDLPVIEQLRSGTEAFVDFVTEQRDAYVGLVRSAAGGEPALRAVFDATRRRFTERVLRGLGVPDPAPARIGLAARGWVAFSEEVVVEWLMGDGGLGRDELVTLLDESLVTLVYVASAGPAGVTGISPFPNGPAPP